MMRVVLVTMSFLVVLPNAALGSEKPASPARPHEITAGAVTSFFIGGFDQTPTAWALDVGYHYRPQKPGFLQALRFTGGMRLGFSDESKGVFDLYGRTEFIANIGPWTPTLGPELGLTTLGRHFIRNPPPYPDDLTTYNETKLSPFYLAFVVTPLRFCFSRFTVSAFELSLGAPMTGIGATARLQLGILQLGGTL